MSTIQHTIQRAYQTELDLNNEQITACKQHTGGGALANRTELEGARPGGSLRTSCPSRRSPTNRQHRRLSEPWEARRWLCNTLLAKRTQASSRVANQRKQPKEAGRDA